MEGIGTYLKRERELRNISLEEIAHTTKIGLTYLQAIESEHLEKLPGITYARGFLKAYAGCVGLNENDILLRFEDLVQHVEAGNDHHDEQLLKRQISKGLLTLIVSLVAVAIMIYYFFS